MHPCDAASLGAVFEAAGLGLIEPILVGPQAKITAAAEALGKDLSTMRIVEAPHSHAAADEAVELVRSGQAEALMKGSLHTDELMGAVVRREAGCGPPAGSATASSWTFPATRRRSSSRTPPSTSRRPWRTSSTSSRTPSTSPRRSGRDVRVAILSAMETVNPKVPSTIEAAALCKMADRGQITGAILDGPLALDNAIDLGAARIKKIRSPVAGQANVLVVPDLEAGNMLAKSLTFLADADAAGIVLGARVPIILTSRADSTITRLASCAVASLVADAQRARLSIPEV